MVIKVMKEPSGWRNGTVAAEGHDGVLGSSGGRADAFNPASAPVNGPRDELQLRQQRQTGSYSRRHGPRQSR